MSKMINIISGLFEVTRMLVTISIIIITFSELNAQGQVKRVNLNGERHLEVLKGMRSNPEFEATWSRSIALKNHLLDSITKVNPEEYIFIEAPTSYEYFFRNFMKTGSWSPQFLKGNIYDKAWVEYLYQNGRTKVKILAIDIEFKQNKQTVINSILGTALNSYSGLDFSDADRIFEFLDSLDQDDPVMPFLYNVAEIGFGGNMTKSIRLRKLFKRNLNHLDSTSNVLDSQELSYIKSVINSYLCGYRLRVHSKRRLEFRDHYFYEQIKRLNDNCTLITGISHVTANNLIPLNIKSLLEKSGWNINVLLIQ